MADVFGADIAGQIGDALGPLLLPATLIKVTQGDRTSGSPTAGQKTSESSKSCRGFTDSYSDGQVDGTLVERGDRKVILLGASIQGGAVPEPGDKVRIEGATLNIVNVDRDPAAATYTCQVRK